MNAVKIPHSAVDNSFRLDNSYQHCSRIGKPYNESEDLSPDPAELAVPFHAAHCLKSQERVGRMHPLKGCFKSLLFATAFHKHAGLS